jgi:hypothetical protein
MAGRVSNVCSMWWTQNMEPGRNKGPEAVMLYPWAEVDGAVGGRLDTGTNYCLYYTILYLAG